MKLDKTLIHLVLLFLAICLINCDKSDTLSDYKKKYNNEDELPKKKSKTKLENNYKDDEDTQGSSKDSNDTEETEETDETEKEENIKKKTQQVSKLDHSDGDKIVDYKKDYYKLNRFRIVGVWYSKNEDRKMTLYRCPGHALLLCGNIRWLGKLRYREDDRVQSGFTTPKRKIYTNETTEGILGTAREGTQIISSFTWENNEWVDGVIHDTQTKIQYDAVIRLTKEYLLGIKTRINYALVKEEFWHR